jgi:hypothetical protein
MAETKKSDEKQAAEAKDEAQARADEALAKGYIGTVPDPNPNLAYSTQTGPDAPPLIDDDRTRFNQPAAPPGPGGTTKEG